MEAIAHGMKPRKGGPSKAVAQEFVNADTKFEHITKVRARNNRS